MLQLSSTYYDRPILGLRTGGPIGHALNPVINPNNLKIEGWYATARSERASYIVPIGEVRDIIHKGIVVNDHSSLTHTEDLVRLKSIIDLGFEIIGKQVFTESKRKLGKVADYAVDDQTMQIKKLYVNQSLLKNLSMQQLIIDRNQIIELNDKRVVVSDASVRAGAGAQATQPA
jgi:sporulation protein YlmC with PRC-barrel domain